MDKEHRMLEARILQGQGKTQVEIAEILGVCERTVRYISRACPGGAGTPVVAARSMPFKAKIDEILEANPYYNGELIYETPPKARVRRQDLGHEGLRSQSSGGN